MTLLETSFSALLVAILLGASLSSVASTKLTVQDQPNRKLAALLAESYFHEIQQLNFVDPQNPSNPLGKDSGESASKRNEFDDVDDFHSYNEIGLTLRNGTSIDELKNWKVSIKVEAFDPSTMLTTSTTSTPLRQVSITLTDPLNVEYSNNYLVSKFASSPEQSSNARTIKYHSLLSITSDDPNPYYMTIPQSNQPE